jgi:hypothetical protein
MKFCRLLRLLYENLSSIRIYVSVFAPGKCCKSSDEASGKRTIPVPRNTQWLCGKVSVSWFLQVRFFTLHIHFYLCCNCVYNLSFFKLRLKWPSNCYIFRPYLAIIRELFTCSNRYIALVLKVYQCNRIFVFHIKNTFVWEHNSFFFPALLSLAEPVFSLCRFI